MNDANDLRSALQQIEKGDESAFQEFYEQTQNRVFNLALSYVRSREDAEEITQDVFIDVFRSANMFKGEASVITWLYRITVNRSLDFLKYKKRQKRLAFFTNLFDSGTGETLHHPADFVHPGVVLENQERAALLFQAINKLSDKQKTAYLLTKVEGLTNSEAADVMGISIGAVESLLQRASDNLKKQLATYYKTLQNP